MDKEKDQLFAIVLIDTKHDQVQIHKYIRGYDETISYLKFLIDCSDEFNLLYNKHINVGFIPIYKM